MNKEKQKFLVYDAPPATIVAACLILVGLRSNIPGLKKTCGLVTIKDIFYRVLFRFAGTHVYKHNASQGKEELIPEEKRELADKIVKPLMNKVDIHIVNGLDYLDDHGLISRTDNQDIIDGEEVIVATITLTELGSKEFLPCLHHFTFHPSLILMLGDV